MKKYWLGVLCVCCMLLTLPAAFASEADAPPDTDAAELMSVIVASGPCGAENPEDLIWTLDDSGLLTFLGSGAIADYLEYTNGSSSAPWWNYRDKINSIEIPAGVTRVGDYAFYRCKLFTQATVAQSVTSIGKKAFYDCYALKSLTLPDGVTEIGDTAFGYCFDLASVTLPESLKKIGTDAFYGCSVLESVTIPQSVTEIGQNAFANCSKLTVTVYQSSYAERCAFLNSVRYTVYGTDIVYIASGPCGAENAEDLLWRLDDSGLLTFLGSGAIADYLEYTNGSSSAPWWNYRDKINSIEIPAGVTRIGDYAFYRCKLFTQATVAQGVTNIGKKAFYDCYALESLAIPESVKEIGDTAFGYCFDLASVTIPESVKKIGTESFYGCSALESVTIPQSVTEIEQNAFANCSKLTATVYQNSYGHRYALLNSVKHEAIPPENAQPALASVTLNPVSVVTGGTSTAVAYDESGQALTSGVTWSVAPFNSGVTISANGAITVSATAVIGAYTVSASCDGVTQSATLNVTRPATPTPTPTGNYALSVLNAQVFPSGTTTYNASASAATSAKPGEIVVLTVGFKNNTSSAVEIGAFGAQLSYDKDKLELYNLFGNKAYQVGADFVSGWMTSPNVREQNDYVNMTAFASGDANTLAANGQTVMARFAFRVKSGAADGNTAFPFDTTRTYVANGANQRFTLYELTPFNLYIGEPGDSGDSSTPTPGPVNVPTIEKLSYPFVNSHAGFGYAKDYRIPLERYEHIFGGKVLSKTLYKLAGLWGGNCYGVSTTSAFFHANADIAAASFNADADAPLKLKLSDNSTTLYMSLQEFIELMQVSQNSPVIQNAYRTHKNQLADLCAAVEEFAATGANPVVIAAFGPQGGHALLGYKLESVSATQSRLYVYDSNFPQDAGRYLTLSVNASGTATGWYYHLNDKYDWGSAFPGCWISYIPYADYCQVWDTRAAKSAGKPSKLELLTVNDDARIYDMEGMPIATIQGGELITGRDDMFPMITLGLTADGDGQQSQTTAVWLPTDLYTVERVASVSSADGPRLLGENDFKASVTHEEQSADVSTTASKVTFAVDDESELNMVVIDENQAGELYDITLSSSLESAENQEVRLTGAVLTKALTFMQVSGEARYSGISAEDGSGLATGVTLTIDGQTFVPAKASMTSVPVASFSANGGEGSISPIAADENGAFTLPECTFKAPAGMTFRCWLVNQTEYQPGQACVITENTAVVAQWKAAEAPVREYALDKLTRNGGTVSVSVTNQSGAGGVLMIAAYSDSGKFLRCAIETVAESRIAKGSAATVSVKLDVSDAKTLRAVMLDADTQKPLSQPISGPVS